MDEVDRIIVHTLRTIGCDIHDDVQSLTQFTTDLIVEAASRCVQVIKHESDVPHKLPPSMSAKFRVGTVLADAVRDIGYKGDIGYQTFLYSNVSDIRKVFIFLLEKMPKESSHAEEETLGSSVLLGRAIAAEVSKGLASPWTPSYFKKSGVCWRGVPPTWQRQGCQGMLNFATYPVVAPIDLHNITLKKSKESLLYYNRYLPYVTNQLPEKCFVAPSVLECNARKYTSEQDWEMQWNQFGLASRLTPEEYKTKKAEKIQKKITTQFSESLKKVKLNASGKDEGFISGHDRAKSKGSRFTHIEKLQYGQDVDKMVSSVVDIPKIDSEEEMKQKRESEIANLKIEMENVISKVKELQLNLKHFQAGNQQMTDDINAHDKDIENKKEAFKVKKKTMDLLPDADSNIEKLQTLVDSSAQRLVSLANQWESHRSPLINKYRELKSLNENRETDIQTKLEEIKRLREKMKEVAADTKLKEDLYKQLVAEHERMGKDVNRAAYTKRILEIVGNIKKQKQDIDKILIDTKSIQKEINQLTGKLDRTFTVTDELVFKDAKKDESVRKAYKFLAALHENCNSIMNTVEETGVILREIRELEDQIEQESNNKVLDNLEKITADYQQLKQENSVLITKFKKQQEK